MVDMCERKPVASRGERGFPNGDVCGVLGFYKATNKGLTQIRSQLQGALAEVPF